MTVTVLLVTGGLVALALLAKGVSLFLRRRARLQKARQEEARRQEALQEEARRKETWKQSTKPTAGAP